MGTRVLRNKRLGNNIIKPILWSLIISTLGSYTTFNYIYIPEESELVGYMAMGILMGTMMIFIIFTIIIYVKKDLSNMKAYKSNYKDWIIHKGLIENITISMAYPNGSKRILNRTRKHVQLIKITINIENNTTFLEEFEISNAELPQEIQEKFKKVNRFLAELFDYGQVDTLIIQRLKEEYDISIGDNITVYQNPNDNKDFTIKNPFIKNQ